MGGGSRGGQTPGRGPADRVQGGDEGGRSHGGGRADDSRGLTNGGGAGGGGAQGGDGEPMRRGSERPRRSLSDRGLRRSRGDERA